MAQEPILAVMEAEFKGLRKIIDERFRHMDTRMVSFEKGIERLEAYVSHQQSAFNACRTHCEEARSDIYEKIQAQKTRQAYRNGINEGQEKALATTATFDYYFWTKMGTLFVGSGLLVSAILFLFTKIFHVG